MPGRSDLDLVALVGAPVTGDIRARRYGVPPPALDEWLTERGELARSYVRLGIQRALGR